MFEGARQAIRQIARSRSHAVTVMAIMALTVGSCVAIFAMVKAVLLADLGYVDSPRLAILWHSRQNAAGVVGVSPGDYASYRESLRTMQALSVVSTRGFNLGAGAASARISCARMTADMFPMLGVPPAQGRWFNADDESARSPVVVVSHRLWTTHLAGGTDAIGSEVALDAVNHRVVGVMPESFTFPPEGVQGLAAADCWVPASFTPIELATPAFNHVIFARLKEGVAWAEAQSDAETGAKRIWSTYPAAVQAQVQLTARLVPLEEHTLERSRTPLYLFAAAVFGLLMIGCANVSNLLLTSFEARQGELAVRASLGATRSAVISQLLIESLLLAAAGGLLGVMVAQGLLSAMIATNATAFPRLADARVDVTALLFAAGCGLLSGVAATLGPAWRAARQVSSNGYGTRSAARGFGANRWRRAVIAFELALAVTVLVLAGMLVRSVAGLNRIDPGFVADDLIAFSVALPEARYQRPDQIAVARGELLARLARLGRVHVAAITSAPPIGEGQPGVVFAGSTAAAPPQYQPALVHRVTPGLVEALRLTMREGRFIEATDSADRGAIAVVNETLARTMFPDGGAVGRSFSRIGAAAPLTIVGIVGDVRQAGPLRAAPPALYIPFEQDAQPVRTLHVVARMRGTAAAAADLRRAVAEVDPELPAFAIRSGNDMLNGTIAVHRFNMLVVGVFAAFALLVAIGGLYSVLAHAVQQARRDFGIRQALGATTARIIRSVLARALAPAVVGMGAGLLAAVAASEWIASLLFGVQPNDPATLATVALLVLALCAVAVLAPAMRAARGDLMTLLRHD